MNKNTLLNQNYICSIGADVIHKWHYQTVPYDTWDYNATTHMILADLTIHGKQRKIVMQAPKNGFFYVLDRHSGELLSAENIVQVNWASHIDLKTGRPVEIAAARFYTQKDKRSVVYPNVIGAHNWHPMSFSPKTPACSVMAPTRSRGLGAQSRISAPRVAKPTRSGKRLSWGAASERMGCFRSTNLSKQSSR
jgi:glucose dehydrogenase